MMVKTSTDGLADDVLVSTNTTFKVVALVGEAFLMVEYIIPEMLELFLVVLHAEPSAEPLLNLVHVCSAY